jgi:hypothetical protein
MGHKPNSLLLDTDARLSAKINAQPTFHPLSRTNTRVTQSVHTAQCQRQSEEMQDA